MALGEKDRGEFAPRGDGARIGRSHRFEQRDKMLARRVVIPFAVAPDDFQQIFDGAFAIALGVTRQSQIVARLMIIGDWRRASPRAAPCRPPLRPALSI